MKIESVAVQQPVIEGRPLQVAAGAVKEVDKTHHKFFEIVKEALEEGSAEKLERIQGLLAQIDDQGARLAKHPNVEELQKYKTLIREFLREAVSHYEVTYDSGSSWGYRNRTYVLVQRVERKLEMLTVAVLNAEAEPINVVAKTDEIKGLLVDLLV